MATRNQLQQNQPGGPYLIQDMDHMVDPNQPTPQVKPGGNRQVEQSHSSNRQQGDHGNSKQRRQAQ